LRLAKGKDTSSSEDKAEYAFDITRVGHIFHYLPKDKKVRQLDGHNILPTEESKAEDLKNDITCKTMPRALCF